MGGGPGKLHVRSWRASLDQGRASDRARGREARRTGGQADRRTGGLALGGVRGRDWRLGDFVVGQ